jgi:hypothetical protein
MEREGYNAQALGLPREGAGVPVFAGATNSYRFELLEHRG